MRIVLLGASGNAGREIARLLTPSLGAGDVMVLPLDLTGKTSPVGSKFCL